MLNRVKCYLVNEATGEQKQFVVPVSSNFSSMKEFAEFAIKEYADVSSEQKVAIFLDGFVIRPSEQLSILRAEDIVTIRYKSKKEEKKWKHEKKEKEKKRRTKKEAAPVVIDNSHNQPPSPGIAIPTNRIIRFDGENGSSSPSTTPLRIREEIAPTYTNTNTPTINARKKKKTRRGKRAGKQVSLKEMKPIAMEGDSVLSTKPEVSFLDYVVNAPPTVTANNTICSSFLETPESQMQSQKQEQSFVQLQQEQSSVHIQQEQSSAHIQQEQPSNQFQQEQPSTDYQQQQQPSMQLQQQQQQPYMPKVEDVIQFHTIVLNRELLSPEVKQVKGRVLSLNGSSVRVYLMQEDDIITVDVDDLKDAVVLKKYRVCCEKQEIVVLL